MPRSGREREGVDWITSLTTWITSPGRVGMGQLISPPAPTMPPAIGAPPSTMRRIVIAMVCQPLAARPLKSVAFAASSSRWNGCGSKSRAKALISGAVTCFVALVNRAPTGRSSK